MRADLGAASRRRPGQARGARGDHGASPRAPDAAARGTAAGRRRGAPAGVAPHDARDVPRSAGRTAVEPMSDDPLRPIAPGTYALQSLYDPRPIALVTARSLSCSGAVESPHPRALRA